MPRWLLGVLVLLVVPAAGYAQDRADSTRTSPDRLLAYSFANDAFLRTDYYFTQGMTLLLVSPALQHSPVNRILGPVPRGSILYHGIRLHYDGFTPLRIQDPFIRVGDRPYASYIYADLLRVARHPARRLLITTALNVGFIGPAAGAKGFQTKLHEWLGAPTPRGWDYQVQTDLVLGYEGRLEKQLLALGHFLELTGQASASVGTLHTYAGTGATVRLGQRPSAFESLGVASRGNRAGQPLVQAYAQAQLEGRLVGYNATLQGGLLNRRSPYVLPTSAVSRAVARGTGTVGVGYSGVRLEGALTWISPEFQGGRAHRWTTLGVQFAF
ncbi:lipid A deacylase LpxR family protein [Hymenobacter sp. 5516J-16]|uniref:lipid A deacylase LpxR family protein n=1 Tax=Hymenobacter sp. 5516J-16 TaxID=2932253 RepID=UPI001FCF9236|nr:lipid A deacylase LpxR family protein [Hymenobacter sp. 5516J-16]UOQ77774.1 lipid A deacylase LpxR family protein [Hymenobacter sp. 5516J-16]